MKKALISPNEVVRTISNWLWDGRTWVSVITEVPNSDRVAQVEPADNIFQVAEPLYWMDCEDDVVADAFYYNNATKQILPVPAPVPKPENPPV